jgi:hypothetical protein
MLCQVIEEGFILDVLKLHTDELYFKLNKAIEDDPKIKP